MSLSNLTSGELINELNNPNTPYPCYQLLEQEYDLRFMNARSAFNLMDYPIIVFLPAER